MCWVRGAEAQIHQINSMRATPLKSLENDADSRGQPLVKYLNSKQLSVRKFLQNGPGYGGTMSEPVNIVSTFTVRRQLNAARNFSNVRVRRMNTAVYDGDAQAMAGRRFQPW